MTKYYNIMHCTRRREQCTGAKTSFKDFLTQPVGKIHRTEDFLRAMSLISYRELTIGESLMWVRVLYGRHQNAIKNTRKTRSPGAIFDSGHAKCQFLSLLALVWHLRSVQSNNAYMWGIVRWFMEAVTEFVASRPNSAISKMYVDYEPLWNDRFSADVFPTKMARLFATLKGKIGLFKILAIYMTRKSETIQPSYSMEMICDDVIWVPNRQYSTHINKLNRLCNTVVNL